MEAQFSRRGVNFVRPDEVLALRPIRLVSDPLRASAPKAVRNAMHTGLAAYRGLCLRVVGSREVFGFAGLAVVAAVLLAFMLGYGLWAFVGEDMAIVFIL
ncbi:MAG: hypothetical protein K2P70_04415 [Hyphomonadaceae bacterium]|nr:hypothetical protein [Hyphomonadaceae bacterium]